VPADDRLAVCGLGSTVKCDTYNNLGKGMKNMDKAYLHNVDEEYMRVLSGACWL
jgi:hypothetical protein